MRKTLKHIFFDLDHTLWDFETNSNAAYRRLLEEARLPVDFERFLETYHPVNRKVWDAYAAGRLTKDQVKILRLKHTLDKLGVELPPDEIAALADRYLELLAEGEALFPGAEETLAYLKTKYRLHLLTNGFAEVQHRKLARTGLGRFFDSVTLSEETGALKPHPRVFRHALEKAGAFPHESLMVGDSVQADMLGALNVGLRAVLFDPAGKEDFPPAVAPTIRRLEELKTLL
ncbi:MAG: noncanonical pyrimidine nucleotidase, YjjG family [Chlorobi bacterium]|nr:noncanonical pyrimidine nucleotidase, YjjG family [Chlorobiota bacterium]